jgi:hypothetical protein
MPDSASHPSGLPHVVRLLFHKEKHPMYRQLAGIGIFLGCIILAVTAKGSAQDFKLETGFVRLDNGTDLKGWTGKIEGWSVKDGAIHLDAKATKGDIYSETTHSNNCVIRMQFRATPKADSGVYIWGKQLQVRDYPTAGPKEYAKPAKPANEWNQLEFNITNGVAEVKLNSEVIEKAWKIGADSKKGVGLQRERGDFDFRYIVVKENKEEPKKDEKKVEKK